MGTVMTWKHKWAASQQYMDVHGEVLDQAEGGRYR